MIKTMCYYPGCNRAADSYYCEAHESNCPKAQGQTKLFQGTRRKCSSAWNRLYHTAAWRKLRREVLSSRPLCAVCGAHATIVDHITPHRGSELLFYSLANLQPLCKRCHSRKTLAENNNFNRRNNDA